MSVYMVLELDADLSLSGLVLDVRMFQQLLGVWPLCVLFDQTLLHEVVEFLGPASVKNISLHSKVAR